MYYDFAYVLEELMDSGVVLVNVITNSISSLISIGTYVLMALGIYTIAKRRAISNPWMAWIPVLNCWLIGCISDQYRYVAKGQVKSKRKSLLVLSIIQVILTIAFFVALLVAVIGGISSAVAGVSEAAIFQSVMVPAIVMLGLLLPMFGVGVAKTIIYYMSMYDLYTSCAPENNALFLVLSIFFRITEPFFVFFNRNNDKGMPPRRNTIEGM